jgi:hypothetical protein
VEKKSDEEVTRILILQLTFLEMRVINTDLEQNMLITVNLQFPEAIPWRHDAVALDTIKQSRIAARWLI